MISLLVRLHNENERVRAEQLVTDWSGRLTLPAYLPGLARVRLPSDEAAVAFQEDFPGVYLDRRRGRENPAPPGSLAPIRGLIRVAGRLGLEPLAGWADQHRRHLAAVLGHPDPDLWTAPRDKIRPDTATLLPIEDYDAVIIAFSGGKDSVACYLAARDAMLRAGADLDRLELWHHLIDGAPGSPHFMDWPVTDAYCGAFAEALGVRLLRQWKVGGYQGELWRKDSLTAPTAFQGVDGVVRQAGGVRGKPNTRGLFPQVTADLSQRWCSAVLKIDVAAMAIRNDPRFSSGGRVLLVTGERRQESANRARYPAVELHRASSSKRIVHQWRPVLDWTTTAVWDRIGREGVLPHPAYDWYGRVSCAWCIFGGPDEWAAARSFAPEYFEQIAQAEATTGKTIHRTRSVRQLADRGEPLVPEADRQDARARLLSTSYTGPILVDPSEWSPPKAAFRATAGPS